MLERRPSVADDVLSAVRAGIRTRKFVPGELYSVYQVAELLGVSRSPVREALIRLAEAGLVTFSRNRGFQVVLPEPRDLAEIFAVRIALEVPAAGRLAARNDSSAAAALETCMRAMEDATDDEAFWAEDRRLHQLILARSGNSRAARIVASLRETTSLLGEPTGRSRDEICAEHRPVVDAVRAGDPAAARSAMASHLTSTGLLLMASVSDVPIEQAALRAIWDDVVSQ